MVTDTAAAIGAARDRGGLPPEASGGWPILGHTVEFLRQPGPVVTRGYREHGDIFRLRLLGGPAVVLLGQEHSRFFFTQPESRLSIRAMYPFFGWMFDSNFYFLAEIEEYRRQRALVLPCFQGRQFESYAESMEAEIRPFLRDLGTSGELDLVTAFGPLVTNIAARAFFGSLTREELPQSYFTVLHQFSESVDPVMPGWLPLPRLVRGRRARVVLRALLLNIIARRRIDPMDPPDFLEYLIEARFDDGEPLPDRLLALVIQ